MKKLAKALWIEKNEGVYIVGPTAELQDDVGTVGFVEFSKNEKLAKLQFKFTDDYPEVVKVKENIAYLEGELSKTVAKSIASENVTISPVQMDLLQKRVVAKNNIEAAQASGATLWDTIKVYLGEGLPELVRVSTVTLISLVGETAMAGAIGAGGLGYIAIYYGYNRSSTSVTILATFLILILIFLIQFLGDFLTRKLSHK